MRCGGLRIDNRNKNRYPDAMTSDLRPRTDLNALGDRLFACLRDRATIEPPTASDPAMSIEDAYAISRRILELRLQTGERLVGKKIGGTSRAVQQMLDVRQPDFGYLTDTMQTGTDMRISDRLIQPRAEGELAFILKRDLRGPGVTPDDVLAATEQVLPCFEIVDSRIDKWRIRIQDTVADNASSGLFVLGQDGVGPYDVDLAACAMTVHKNGALLSEGRGDASDIGSPQGCVAWLANTLGAFGIPLLAGEVILSGSLVPLEPVVAGDQMRCTIEGIGSVDVRFV